jgi:hypothetical protein
LLAPAALMHGRPPVPQDELSWPRQAEFVICEQAIDVLERMVSGQTKAHELERLLPWTWKAEQLAAAVHA